MDRIGVAPILLAVLLTGGCLESESTTTIGRDGKGTYARVVTVDLEKARAFHAAQAAQIRGLGIPAGEEEEDPFAALDDERRAADLERRGGVRVVVSTVADDEAKAHRTWTTQIAFDALRRLYETGAVEDVDVRLERTKFEGQDAWTLTIRHAFEGSEASEDDEHAEALRKMRAAMLARYEPFWGTLRVVSTLNVPTRILESNGEVAEDRRSATWRIGFRDLPDSRKLLQRVTFAASEALELEPFTVTAQDVANMLDAEALEREAEGDDGADGEEKDE
jgi:hypothetical protein